MSFAEAVKSGFANYANFTGRSSRSAYWWWVLFVFLVEFIPYFGLLSSTPAAGEDASGTYVFWAVLVGVIWLALILPWLSAAVRRLHDTGRSGWWYFISLVPCIGFIWLIILLVTPSTPGPNQYG
jgi:uncharacterized membrane protein YhaH (DUF805 family)